MKFFFWLAFLVLIGVAVFAVQNSTAPVVDIKFLIWHVQTSLVYTILGSLALGMIIALLLSIPSVFKNSRQIKSLKREIEILERARRHEERPSEQESHEGERTP